MGVQVISINCFQMKRVYIGFGNWIELPEPSKIELMFIGLN